MEPNPRKIRHAHVHLAPGIPGHLLDPHLAIARLTFIGIPKQALAPLVLMMVSLMLRQQQLLPSLDNADAQLTFMGIIRKVAQLAMEVPLLVS
jgi:hypothetical protein